MTLSLSQTMLILVALAGGAGTIGAAFAAGVLQRWIRPAIREEIRAHEGEAATVDARRTQIRIVVDEQVHRDDGIIRSHTRERDDARDEELRGLRATLATVLDELAQLRGMLAVALDRQPERQTPTRTIMAPHGTPPR